MSNLFFCRVWHRVVQNIQHNNEKEAIREKTIVEEGQRGLEHERKERKEEWVPRLFARVKDDYYVHKSLSTMRYSALLPTSPSYPFIFSVFPVWVGLCDGG